MAETGQQARFGAEYKSDRAAQQSLNGSLPPRANNVEPEITPNDYTEVQQESRVQFRTDLPQEANLRLARLTELTALQYPQGYAPPM